MPTARVEDVRVTRLHLIHNPGQLPRVESGTFLAGRGAAVVGGKRRRAGPRGRAGPAPSVRPVPRPEGQTFSATRPFAATGAGAAGAGSSGAAFSSSSIVFVKPNQYVATKPAT
ncbi:hypothetical protein GA0115245_13516 [Streptomyces sp. di188]|nr:hypothetical protein GA0115238_12426 [Streptomyces sp. di50b]SCE42226.1 hypothetical protein GA0115245_13516 [Streptomyces sp. di188]